MLTVRMYKNLLKSFYNPCSRCNFGIAVSLSWLSSNGLAAELKSSSGSLFWWRPCRILTTFIWSSSSTADSKLVKIYKWYGVAREKSICCALVLTKDTLTCVCIILRRSVNIAKLVSSFLMVAVIIFFTIGSLMAKSISLGWLSGFSIANISLSVGKGYL